MFPSFAQILALSFFLPGEFAIPVFGLVLMPYRVLLLASTMPAIVSLQQKGRLNVYDFLIAALAVPILASMMYNQGFSDGLAAGGMTALEIAGSYFCARAYLNTRAKLTKFMNAWIVFAAIVLPILIAESLLKQYLVHPLLASLTGIHFVAPDIKDAADVESASRLGVLRATGPFAHPILCGCAYAAFFPYFLIATRGIKRVASLAILLLGVLVTVSSTAIMMLAIEVAVCASFLAIGRREWKAPVRSLMLILVPTYFAVNALSNRGLFQVLSTTIALNPWTGYYRTLIWSFGMDDMWSHPVFGLGYNDWARPAWMSSSIDAYWLVIGMRHGAVAFFLWIGVNLSVYLDALSKFCRYGWLNRAFRIEGAVWMAVFSGLTLGGIVVDYWGPIAMFVPMMLGILVNLNGAVEQAYPAHQRSFQMPVGRMVSRLIRTEPPIS